MRVLKVRVVVYLIIWLCLVLTISAQTNRPNLEKENLIRQNVRLRADFIDEWHPFKVIGGTLYDFTPFYVFYSQYEYPSGFGAHYLKGKVLQVVEDGLLLTLDDSEVRVHLRNYIDEKAVLDGSHISALADICGRYQYLNTQGARTTIADYDCGHRYDPKKEHFENKTLVYRNEDAEQKIPELDLKAFAELNSRINLPSVTTPALKPAPAPRPRVSEYTIISGDNLNSIATKFHVSIEAINQENPEIKADKLNVGQRIRIP